MKTSARVAALVLLAVLFEVCLSQKADGQPELPVPLTIIFPDGAAGPVPVTVGVPLPSGVPTSAELTVVGPSGPVPTQTREIVRLGEDGEVRWLLVDFQAEPGGAYSLHEGATPSPSASVVVTPRGEGGVVVNTGAGNWEIPAASELLASVTGATSETLLTGATWGESSVSADVEVVDEGPLRAMVRVRAQEAVSGLDLVGRLHFYAGLPYARVRITLTNHRPALTWAEAPDADNGECSWPEAGQPACNGLLSPNRIEMEDLTWTLRLANPPAGPDEVLYQDSSGTDRWDYYADLRATLGLQQVPRMQGGATFRGFRHTRGAEVIDQGDIADGTIAAGGVRLDVPWFRELFPKALRIRGGNLEFGIFPEEFSTVHRLRAGEQKTQDVWVGLDPGVVPPWPVYAAPEFKWLRATHALGYIGPRVAGSFPEYEDYIDAQFDDSRHTVDDCNNDLDECATGILNARVLWDYYGWMDFGDIPTDFENPRSPLNMKYNINLGFLQQALRTGDVRWWHTAHAANLHAADIDIFHSRKRGYEVDRIWWEGGIWGHSYHNEQGLTCPHRNCGQPNVDTGGGGCGLLAWALLTGDDVVREAAIELADNTLWRALNAADTACAITAWGGGSGEGYTIWPPEPGENPPARPVANIQRTMVWAWRLTGDTAYLDAAAGAARWYQCESENFLAASWPEALLARSMGAYILGAQGAGISVDPAAEPALLSLLQAMADPSNLTRQGDRAWFSSYTGDEINAWMLLAADAFAYGYGLTGDRSWLDEYALPCFNTGSRDPYYEGDTSQYHTMKEVANVVPNGTVFIHFVHAAASEFRVTQVEASGGGNVTLAWSSLSGRTYSVYRSDDLFSWELAEGDISSMGDDTTTWVDPSAPLLSPGVPRRYYRIEESE